MSLAIVSTWLRPRQYNWWIADLAYRSILSYFGVICMICGSGCGSGFWCWHALLVWCGRATWVYIDVRCICDHYVAKFAVKCHDLSYFGVICGSGSGSGSGLCSKIKKWPLDIPKNMLAKFGVGWCSGVSPIDETKVWWKHGVICGSGSGCRSGLCSKIKNDF